MKIKCPNCKSPNFLKQGFRINENGKKQKYQCIEFKKEIIAKAIHQHIDGFSLFKVQYHLWQHEGIKVSRKTILLWTKKYSIFLKSNK